MIGNPERGSPAKRPVSLDDLFRLRLPGSPQLSPEGSRVVLSLQLTDLDENKAWSHLWVVPTDGSPPRQFTFGKVLDTEPRWSPDGQKLAFFRTQNDRTQIWFMPADGGEPRPLTELDEGHFKSLAWSPDGTRLAFAYRPTDPQWTRKARNERKQQHRSDPPRVITRLLYRLDGFGYYGDTRQHVWTCDTATGQTRSITDGDYDDRLPCWSPDGSTIAFIANRSDDPEGKPYQEDIWLVPSGGGPLKRLPTSTGYKSALSWSPDGNWFAFVGRHSQEDPWVPRNDQLWAVAAQGHNTIALTANLNRTASNVTLSDVEAAFGPPPPPWWSSDSRSVFFLASDTGSTHVYRADLDGTAPMRLTHGAKDISAVHGTGKKLVWLESTPCRPAALFAGTIVEGQNSPALQDGPKPLWNPNEGLFDTLDVAEPEELRIPCDGAELQAWILRPLDFDATRRYPFVFYIHGGPHAQYGNAFFHEFQFLAAQGYVVAYSNPRGSMGREEDFAACIRGRWGEQDYRDALAVLDHVSGLPYLDAQRVGVAGGSYGGYMTNWLVGHTDRFRCAITDRSVVDLVSMAGTCDIVFMPDGYWPGNWWDGPEAMWQQSPLKWIGQCHTPLLIIHSEGDLRCPISQAEQLYAALKRMKRKVVLVRYPSETSHGMSRSGPPDLRRDRLERIAAWLDRYLK